MLEIYFFLWNLRNFVINRKSHNSYFPLNYNMTVYINNFLKGIDD